MLHLYNQGPLNRALEQIEQHPETLLLIDVLKQLNNWYYDFLASDWGKRSAAGVDVTKPESSLSQGFEYDDELAIESHKAAQSKAFARFFREYGSVWSTPQKNFLNKYYEKLEKCLDHSGAPRITIFEILANIFPRLRPELLSSLTDKLLFDFINQSDSLNFDKNILQSTRSYLAKTYVFQAS